MKVLVTGGAGYIGSVVVEVLLSTGHEVVVLDDFSKGHREAVPAGVPIVELSILDRDRLTVALSENAIEAVVHMAADSLVGESVTKPAKYYETNVVGGLNLLHAMRTAEVPYLVFSSSAAVYGEPEAQPITEQSPTKPTNPYGQTKLALEDALTWYSRAYDLSFVSLRYFNAAGASERNGELHDPETHLIPIVLEAARGDRRAVTIFGSDYPTPDGTCIRDYIHVLDLADAHVMSLEALAQRRFPSKIFNLGCGLDGYSVRQVLSVAERVTGRAIPFEVGPRRQGDPAVLVASADEIRRELGFVPRRQDLEVIVESAWRWMMGSASWRGAGNANRGSR